jgi:transposase
MFARFSNAIFYVLSTGCQWQALPKDLPPKSTAHSYFMLWDWDGTLERIHHALYVATREREGREASAVHITHHALTSQLPLDTRTHAASPSLIACLACSLSGWLSCAIMHSLQTER